ncbi:hypothetical protein BATDEDRAFT_33197 [Batrachochytrium dendrobatidis JAM81]|uniref:Chromosome segregation in meiosis protein n=1 Tax=Batrachochytrium dendrobatidis (strain JAM81 / FGSC 10211) TaxID=684364 RepID=F4P1Y0_BATDJ|nr:uncharacterized protein BATDEDRAFT_33197 [Batrachochytrium dendrobatidis JAM81]EGF80764.1 hypothetical protein BATDEDRAFT_33197 [Batrachochytrium dendrobatidis JAM81]|eukprot:XP_006678561.1 hypothetical protein BATDEDRAFT_33197 [Batrachochytrium dendrobatidis JAM81]
MMFDDLDNIPQLPEDISMNQFIQQAKVEMQAARQSPVLPFHSKGSTTRTNIETPPTVPLLPTPQQKTNGGTSSNVSATNDSSLMTNPLRVRAKLDEERLLSPTGLPLLLKCAKKMRFGGKGSELKNLERLLKMYQIWGLEVYPKLKFGAFIERTENVCKKRRMKLFMMQLMKNQERKELGIHGIEADYDSQAEQTSDDDCEDHIRVDPNADIYEELELQRAAESEAFANTIAQDPSLDLTEDLDDQIPVSQSLLLKRRKNAIVDSDEDTENTAPSRNPTKSLISDQPRYKRSTLNLPESGSTPTTSNLTSNSASDAELALKQKEIIDSNRQRAMLKLAEKQAERERALKNTRRVEEEARVAAMLAEASPFFTDN